MTADNKEKALGKDLIWTMLFCFFLGLMLILSCLWIYYRYWGDLQLTPGDESVPAYIYEGNLAVIRILVFGVLPILSFGFFCVGYKLWKYYRHCKPSSAAR